MGKGAEPSKMYSEKESKPNMTCPICGRRFRVYIVDGAGAVGRGNVPCGPTCRAIKAERHEGPPFADCY